MAFFDGKAANTFFSTDGSKSVLELYLASNNRSSTLLVRGANGRVLDGIPSPGCAPTQVVVGGGTIAVGTTRQFWGVAPLAPESGVTGVIMEPGLFDGQLITLVVTSASSVTFDPTPATSLVSSSTMVLAPDSAATLVWRGESGAWFPTRPSA